MGFAVKKHLSWHLTLAHVNSLQYLQMCQARDCAFARGLSGQKRPSACCYSAVRVPWLRSAARLCHVQSVLSAFGLPNETYRCVSDLQTAQISQACCTKIGIAWVNILSNQAYVSSLVADADQVSDRLKLPYQLKNKLIQMKYLAWTAAATNCSDSRWSAENLY